MNLEDEEKQSRIDVNPWTPLSALVILGFPWFLSFFLEFPWVFKEVFLEFPRPFYVFFFFGGGFLGLKTLL